MNPLLDISPPQDTNTAVRRLLNVFVDLNSKPRPGAPGGPVTAKNIGDVIRHGAANPAYLLVPADDTRAGGLLRNLDTAETIYYGSNPNVDDQTGATMLPGEIIPINIRGSIYIYHATLNPIAEFVPIQTT